MDHTPLTISVPKAAKRLGVSIPTMRELLASEQISYVQIGARRMVPVKAIEEFIEREATQVR